MSTRHFKRKTDAQAWLDSVTTAQATGTYAAPAKGRQTFAAMAERWFEAGVGWSETTRARNRGQYSTRR